MASLSVTSLQHRCRARIGAGAVAMSALAVAACGSGGSGVVGLPAEDFDRAYTAGLDVAAAERCGAGVDAGLVRYNLVEDAKRRGLAADVAEKSGRAFDKTRMEFAQRLAQRPDYCVSGYAVNSVATR
jgi:hypothetical protein